MLNKSCFKNLKKKLISLCVAIGLITSAFTGLIVGNYSTTHAYSSDPSKSSTYFSDPNFSQGGTNPTYWKVIEGEGNYNSERMVAGIFDSETTTTSYLKKYKVFENPGVPTSETLKSNDNRYNSLSLSAPYPAGGNFGYKPSSSKLNLAKDSFYVISVNLKTAYDEDTTDSDIWEEGCGYSRSIDSRASLYITGFSDEEVENIAKFEMIESKFGKDPHNGWGTFCFYIATNQLKAESSLDLEVWLGSKSQVSSGNVFFNSVKVEQLDHNTFARSTQTLGVHSTLIDMRDEVNTSPITNANFEEEVLYSGWSTLAQDAEVSSISVVDASTFGAGNLLYDKHNLSASDLSSTNLRSSDNKILFMANSENSYTAVESIDEFKFARQKYYKLSVWGWSNNSGTSASIKLVNTTEDIEIANASLNLTTSSSKNNATNGWTEYSFYVYGDKFVDTTAKLQLAIGSEESKSSGYAYFDNVTLQEITYKQYSDNSSGSNCTTFNYNTSNDTYKISNYSFDITENETINNAYPLTPAAWTYKSEEVADKTIISGIVNTNSTLFNSDELKIEGSSSPSNPGKLPYQEEDAFNNVLMMGSRYTSSQSYTSSSLTLNANSYYKISLYVNAPNGGAKIRIYNSNGTIIEKSNITSVSWTNFVTYIKTGSSEDAVVVELSLINDTTNTKFVFFDDVTLTDSSESVYNGVVESTNTSNYSGTFTSKVDRLNYNFENDSTTESVANGFSVEGSATSDSFVKIQNTYEEYNIYAKSGDNALVVYSNDNVNGVNYHATTKRNIPLASGSYYKISVFVKTKNIGNGGATITLAGTGLDKSFYDINTEMKNVNEWTEYTFYVNAKVETSANLQLGLGNNTTKSSGYALFDDITITKLDVADDEAFEALTSGLNSQVEQVITVEEVADETTDEESEEKEDAPFEGSFNWYIVTSLVTALAIIIAVVGVMLRKINFKRTKKVKTSYDRRKTLDVSIDKKERIARRQEEIKLLEKQLKEIEDEIAGIKHEVEVEQQEFAAEHDKAKAVIEERRDAIVKEKEAALHDRNEKIAKDKNAFTREEEEKFAQYIKKLEKQELKENQQLQKHDKAVSNFKTAKSVQLQRIIARKEFIKAEIARIDAEIEEIAKEEAQIWEDYKQAKADAKKRKAEYKAEVKASKTASKKSTKSTNNTEKSEEKKEDEVEIIKPDEDKSE